MSKKNSAIINIVAFISLAIFGYLLFFTVYRQMISQNEGFFYVIVFGGILVLVYILLSLMTKLLAFSPESESKTAFYILEAIFIVIMSVLFVKVRIEYSTSIPGEESVIYRTAELIGQDALSMGGMDLFPQLLNNPSTFIMGSFLAFIFKFTGEDPAVIIYLNTGLLLAASLFVFGITRRLCSRICSLLAFITCLFMPSFGFSVYSFNPQIFFAFVMSLAILLLIIPITQAKSNTATIVLIIFAGIVWGILLSMEPAAILILILILVFNRNNPLNAKLSVITVVTAVLVFFIFAFLKSISLDLSFGEIINGFITSCNPFINESGDPAEIGDIFSAFNNNLDSHQKAINDNYYFLSKSDGSTYSSVAVAWIQLGNQILYMFIIILSIACSFYMIRSRHSRAIPVLSGIIASFLMVFLGSQKDYNILFFILLLIICGSTSLKYMYENHHAEANEDLQEIIGDEDEEPQNTDEEEMDEQDEAAFLLRAQALVFYGANDGYYQQIKTEERKQIQERIQNRINKETTKIKPEIEPVAESVPEPLVEPMIEPVAEPVAEPEIEYLDNPLPVPPKHVHKELDFDEPEIDSKSSDFDFDIELTDDDLDNYNDFDED